MKEWVSFFETSCEAPAPLRMTTINSGQKILVANLFCSSSSLIETDKVSMSCLSELLFGKPQAQPEQIEGSSCQQMLKSVFSKPR